MLLQRYKTIRISKAISRQPGKPPWVDFRVRSKLSREAYAMAAKHERKFSRAFIEAVRGMLPVRMPEGLREAYERGDLDAALSALPLLGRDNNDSKARLTDAMLKATMALLDASGQAEADALKKRLGIDAAWTVHDGSNSEVVKRRGKTDDVLDDIDARWLVPIVPVNPYAKRWSMAHCMDLVTEGITPRQHETARLILQDNFAHGRRAELVYRDLKQNIGLLPREWEAVFRRRVALEDADLGYTARQIDALVAKYSDELLGKRAERIARTETIAAQAEGRLEMWKLADGSGQLGDVERKWVAAPESDRPDRPCQECLSLDGQTVGINDSYQGLKGPILRPPAHPHCRCLEVLERKQ